MKIKMIYQNYLEKHGKTYIPRVFYVQILPVKHVWSYVHKRCMQTDFRYGYTNPIHNTFFESFL